MHIFHAEMTRKNVIGPCFLLLMTCFSIVQSDCVKPTFTIHTILDLDLPVYDLGESINVSCPENHAFFQEVHRDEPFVIITCLSHTWNTSQIPNCGSLYSDVTEVADCADLGPDPIPPSAGNRSLLVGNGTSYLSVYRYFCQDGYTISSAPIVQCRGTWDQLPDDLNQPTCEKLMCRLPDSTPVVSFSPEVTTLEVGMSVTVVCAPGFEVRGQAVITCTPYARLDSTPACEDVNECSSSPSPCDHICFNTMGSYRCQCNSGYHLAEDETTCEDDDECTAYPTLCPDGTCQNVDGSYTCSCDSVQGYVLFTEDGLEGFVKPESERLLDSINNTLRINHTCVPRQCASPDLPNGYLLNPQPTFHVGDTQSFDCKLGYILMGDNTITCMPNGDWSAQIPQCETAFCGNVTFGEVVSESCNGLDVQRTCVYNRDTDMYTLGLDAPFMCPDMMCEPEPSEVDVGNGYLQFLSGNEGSVGSEYRIVCNSSANLTGSTLNTPGDVVTCGVDGRWSLGTAYCLDQCEDAVCAMNGVCVENGTDTLCACPSGETIEDCDSPLDPCESSPCPNNTAQCQPLGSVRRLCICDPGWTGKNCETDIDECSSKPCLNGARCEDGINGYTCTCLDGYEGPQCQSTPVCPTDTECPGCMANYREGGVLCRCPRGYRTNDTVDRSGRWWENFESVSTGCIPEDPCDNDPCLNGGTCSPASAESQQGSSLYTCSCASGFIGQRCQIETDECASSPCRNGGTCVDLHNGYMCRCLNNTGSYLSPDCILGCESDPCSPDGTSSRGCQDSFDDYYCPCEDGYTGKDCETDIDDCTPSPCLHGGLCTDGTNSFTCTCQSGWEGPTCNQVSSSCSPTACTGNATCIDLFNDYFCLCEDMSRTDCDARFSICGNGDACYGDSVCVDGGCDCSAASPSRVGDRCFLVQDQCATGCRVNDLCRTGHGDFVCGTRGQEPKQLFLTKSVPMNWINTHVNFACTDVCQEVITALEPKLGTTRYVGAAPSADNRITVVIENFGFVSQTSEIQTELRDLSLTVLPLDIYGVGFEAVRPGFGPQAGGTLITITGYNLLEGFTVLIGEINCPVVMSNRVVIICSTSELVDASQLGSTLSVYVVGSERLYTGHKFTYRGNPAISSVMPLRTIMSGGIPLVVEGTNLDSVHQPLMITTVRRNNGGTETVFETACTVISASTLNCPTPDISSAVQQRRKRHVSTRKARVRRQGNVAEDVTITIGFQFDGLLDFMDLTANEELAEYGMITPHDNPEIFTFDEEDGTLTFRSTWPFSERQIQIMGSRLAPAVTTEAVTVRVGRSLCTVEDVQPDLIVCAPPVNRPEVAANQFREDGLIPVQVKIGNLNFEAGHVIYIQNIWEYLPARIGIIVAIVVLVLAVIILACCCYRKHRREYPDFPDISESPRRPIVFRRQRPMTLISRQGRPYGSTHSVGIFRRSQHHVRSISRRLGTGEYGSEIFY